MLLYHQGVSVAVSRRAHGVRRGVVEWLGAGFAQTRPQYYKAFVQAHEQAQVQALVQEAMK